MKLYQLCSIEMKRRNNVYSVIGTFSDFEKVKKLAYILSTDKKLEEERLSYGSTCIYYINEIELNTLDLYETNLEREAIKDCKIYINGIDKKETEIKIGGTRLLVIKTLEGE